ncbi:MAG: TIGR04219 family outer membrane beta-barrel protein [Spongiibacteraceae bacterium]|jgi:outer membrane protein
MRYPLISAGLACALSTTAIADTIGFEIGAYAWQPNFSGSVESGKLSSNIDIEDDLGFDDESSTVFYALLEHPIPLIPNLRIQQTELDISTNNTTAPFSFGGEVYTGNISSNIDLSHTDLTFYYEILDNWVSLDVGFTARIIQDGLVEIHDRTTNQTESFEADGVLPLLYLAARFELPLTGLYAGGDINGLGINNDSIIDYKVNIGYETSIGLGLEAGYRNFSIDYDDNNDTADLTIDGAYISAFYHF